MRNAGDIGCHLGVRISFKHSSSTNISQNIDKVSQKALLWPCKLASKYKVTCHTRNMPTKFGGSPLSFGPPVPQSIGDHYSKVVEILLVLTGEAICIGNVRTVDTFSVWWFAKKYTAMENGVVLHCRVAIVEYGRGVYLYLTQPNKTACPFEYTIYI